MPAMDMHTVPDRFHVVASRFLLLRTFLSMDKGLSSSEYESELELEMAAAAL
jgi:hypothetical protein